MQLELVHIIAAGLWSVGFVPGGGGEIVAKGSLFTAAGFSALAGVVVPDHVFAIAALGEASASASLGVEELIGGAQTLVLASLALAAVGVPDGTAWAGVGNNSITSEGVDAVDQRNTEALAHALFAVPGVVDLALLDKAGTFASLSVPVVGVIDAGLGSANPFAGLNVPGVNDTSGAISVGSSEGTDASTELFVPVVVGVLAGVADSELAVVHVPVLTSRDLRRSVAAACAGLGIEEVAFIASLVFALAAAGHRVPFVAVGAKLLNAAALTGFDVPVEANWASAVLWEA